MRRLRALAAFPRRDWQVALSYRVPLVLELASAAFTVVIFRFVAELVPPGRVPGGYFAFVMVGLALAAFLQAGITIVSGNVRQEQVQGTLEPVLAAGLPTPLLAAGLSVYPLASAAVRALAFVVLGAALGAGAPHANWFLAIIATALGSVSFAGLGLGAAALALLIRQVAAATAWLVTVLVLAAGAFFPQQLLPVWVRSASELSPFTHTLRLARSAILEGASWSSSVAELATLTSLAAVYAALGAAALGLALRWARRVGTLAQY